MTFPLPPEMKLVAACCRWPPSPDRDTAVREAAEGVDWTRVVRSIARHRVAPLALSALTAAKVELPDAARPLLRAAMRAARKSDQLAGESARLQALFDAAGIAALVVKGAPLAQLAYGAVALKEAKDIDLLIAERDVPTTVALLQREEYVLRRPAAALSASQLDEVVRYDRGIELVGAKSRMQIDMHWGLSRNRSVLPEIDAGAPTRPVDLGRGRMVRTLRHDDLLAYLLAHGASHGWFRLKWLADVAALISSGGPAGIERLYRSAVERRIGPSAGQALLLAEELLALDLPPALAAELRADRRVRRLVAAALDLICGDEPAVRRHGQLRMAYAQSLLIRDWHDFRSGVAQYLTVTSDVLAVPLPRRLHALYPLLRLPLGIGRVAGRLARRARSGGH